MGGDSETRSQLVRAAIELIEEGGPDALTLRALGEACGLSRAAPYRHFADKDALRRSMAAAGMADLADRMATAAGRARTRRLRAASLAYVEWALDHPHWYRLTFQDRATSPSAAASDPEIHAASQGLLSLVLELMAESAPTADPQSAMTVLWAALHGSVDLALSGHMVDGKPAAKPRRTVELVLGLLDPSA